MDGRKGKRNRLETNYSVKQTKLRERERESGSKCVIYFLPLNVATQIQAISKMLNLMSATPYPKQYDRDSKSISAGRSVSVRLSVAHFGQLKDKIHRNR